MAPAGSPKRVKPNPSEGDSRFNVVSPGLNDPSVNQQHSAGDRTPERRKENGTSWYIASWPRRPKAAAVTEVARESISGAGATTPEPAASAISLPIPSKPTRSSSIELTKKGGVSTRSLPADATTTRINIASGGSVSLPDASDCFVTASTLCEDKVDGNCDGSTEEIRNRTTEHKKELDGKALELGPNKVTSTADLGAEPEAPQKTIAQSSSWLAWLSIPKHTDSPTSNPAAIDESRAPNITTKTPAEVAAAPEIESGDNDQTPMVLEPQPIAESSTSAPRKRSWLQMWGGASIPSQQENVQKMEILAENSLEPASASAPADEGVSSGSQGPQSGPVSEDKLDLAVRPPAPPKPSGWAFWSREAPKNPSEHEITGSSSAELASVGSVSQKPFNATIEISEPPEPPPKTKDQPKQLRVEDVSASPQGGSELRTSSSSPPPKPKVHSTSPGKRPQALPNQLLPSFKDTFAIQEKPGIFQQLGRLLRYTQEPETRHVSLAHDPPRVKRALAIGIHGYFPAPLIRSVLGQPTGTSVKFSTLAAKAIRQWTEDHGYSCEVEKISLEGEGRIAERIDLLWKLLLNWIEEIRKADFIMISCHSQGVPVATILVAKLISFGCVTSTRIGICAMAGISLGPFPEYRSRWISGSAAELFDFSNPESKVSQDYMAALDVVLRFGTRIVYIGSIDDQLVSLESSIFAPVSHPHIYRAVFVDGRVHAPSFLSHLVGFALKLRNLGISDHGLIRELSSPLAGSLYSGEGHSRVYDDEAVYYLAVEYTLETTSVNNPTLQIHKINPLPNANPYILPFVLRGLLEEDYVRRELTEDTTELLKLFDDWKPSSKALKDVKFRLEGIRSKL